MIDFACIYSIIHLPTKWEYIGSTNNMKRRRFDHITLLKQNRHHSSKLQELWNKSGPNEFDFRILEICQSDIRGKRETWWIERTKKLLNTNRRVKGCWSHSEETKKKISDSRKGRPTLKKGFKHSAETKEKLSKIAKESKKHIKYANNGFKHSEESKKKISKSKSGTKSSTAILTEEEVIIIRTIVEEARKNNRLRGLYQKLGKEFKVKPGSIYSVAARKTWRYI